MDSLVKLSANHCILLAVQLARDSNVAQLQNLTAYRRDAFTNEVILRILLTCLPESTEPSTYIHYAKDIADNVWEHNDSAGPDASSVNHLTPAQARKRVKKLELLPLAHPLCQYWESKDLLTLFLVHRSYRIDQEADLLVLVPQLIDPFLDTSQELRTWFISTVLPLLRLSYEYYTQGETTPSLEDFSRLSGLGGVTMLLSRSQEPGAPDEGTKYHGARDLRGLVGPWMYGSSARKRRKLNSAARRLSVPASPPRDIEMSNEAGTDTQEADAHHDWESAFEYLVQEAANSFDFVTETVEQWNGPPDVDLGGFDNRQQDLDPEVEQKLHTQYCQAIFAAVYTVQSDTMETLEGVHGLLVRLASLLQYEPPPHLGSDVDMLPRLDSPSKTLSEATAAALLTNVLLKSTHPLTTPSVESYTLLQMFAFSAYILNGLKNSISISNVAKFRLQSSKNEQLSMLQKILHLSSSGVRKDEHEWDYVRQNLIWLWNWGFADIQQDDTQYGQGIFGKIEIRTLEKEILKTFLSAGCFALVDRTYISPGLDRTTHGLPSLEEVEETVIASAMQFYDNASNGNRTRGGMKKASDIISHFRTSFPQSTEFERCNALLSATHALSFYSLTLQHGVPFQPVSIRVSQDPLSLLQKVLEQNPQSYSKLDDLILIGRNLVSAGLGDKSAADELITPKPPTEADLERQRNNAERRIVGMAIEQALAEDDFETAYSYVVNRLNPAGASALPSDDSSASGPDEEEDDLSWRAAFLAGRHRSATDLSGSAFSTGSGAANLRKPGLRRLEQRMELLSQALLLAPPAHLPEVLAAWRRCEEEMGVLLAQEAEEEDDTNERAASELPGAFGPSLGVTPVQTRREVGRGAVEEAPMGLFDVARGAAAAFSRSAFPLHGAAAGQAGPAKKSGEGHRQGQRSMSGLSMTGSDAGDNGSGQGQERVRKRDLVANAATGALASGIGWVLGATPVNQQQQER